MNHEILSPEPKQYVADIKMDEKPTEGSEPTYSLVIGRMEASATGLVVPSDDNVSLPLGRRDDEGKHKMTKVWEIKADGETVMHTVPLFDKPHELKIFPGQSDDDVVFNETSIEDMLRKYAEGARLADVDRFIEESIDKINGKNKQEYPGFYL